MLIVSKNLFLWENKHIRGLNLKEKNENKVSAAIQFFLFLPERHCAQTTYPEYLGVK